MLTPIETHMTANMPSAVYISVFDICAEPPRLRTRMVANAAPPPRTADASANSCEMLTKEPTTSSGDGMAWGGFGADDPEGRGDDEGDKHGGNAAGHGLDATKSTHLLIPRIRVADNTEGHWFGMVKAMPRIFRISAQPVMNRIARR